MNVRPLWGYRASHLVETRMHILIEQHIMRENKLPTPEQITAQLRADQSLRGAVANLFKTKCSVEMTEVDYEIGIRHATGNLNHPKTLDIAPQMVEMIKTGIANAGQIIEAFYRGEPSFAQAGL